jgi:hypothetical protein
MGQNAAHRWLWRTRNSGVPSVVMWSAPAGCHLRSRLQENVQSHLHYYWLRTPENQLREPFQFLSSWAAFGCPPLASCLRLKAIPSVTGALQRESDRGPSVRPDRYPRQNPPALAPRVVRQSRTSIGRSAKVYGVTRWSWTKSILDCA